jgi:hypothetical protein
MLFKRKKRALKIIELEGGAIIEVPDDLSAAEVEELRRKWYAERELEKRGGAA